MKNNCNNKNKVNKQAKNKKSQNTIFISGCKTQGSNLDRLVNDEAHLKEAIETGFKRYLPKPFLVEDLQKSWKKQNASPKRRVIG